MSDRYFYIVIKTNKTTWSTCCIGTPFGFYLNNELHNSSGNIIYSEEITESQFLAYQSTVWTRKEN